MAVDLLREEDALGGYVAALRRRLAEVGVDDLSALLARDPTDSALAVIERDEIARALASVHRLVEGLATMLGHLQGLRQHKQRLAHASSQRMPER